MCSFVIPLATKPWQIKALQWRLMHVLSCSTVKFLAATHKHTKHCRHYQRDIWLLATDRAVLRNLPQWGTPSMVRYTFLERHMTVVQRLKTAIKTKNNTWNFWQVLLLHSAGTFLRLIWFYAIFNSKDKWENRAENLLVLTSLFFLLQPKEEERLHNIFKHMGEKRDIQ